MRIFGPKRDDLRQEWRRIRNEELHDLYSSPSIIKIKKSGMGRACSTYGRQERCIQGLIGNSEGIDHLENIGVDGRIILKWIFMKWHNAWTGLMWLGIGTGLL